MKTLKNHSGPEMCYGLDDLDRLIHVSKASNGLNCGLRCPGCFERLVARQGKILVAHLAHNSTSSKCRDVWGETTLHLLAKQIIEQSSQIMLPAKIARLGDQIKFISAEKMICYGNVRKEQTLDGIRPDIIIEVKNIDVLIEIFVTHACDDDKIAKLHNQKLISMEIDFSGVDRFGSLSEHTKQILETAPRKWLYHPSIARLELEFKRNEAEKVAELNEALAKKNCAYNRIGEEISECWNDIQREDSDLIERFENAGFGEYIGLNIPGDKLFNVGSKTWQVAILELLVSNDLSINSDFILKHLQAKGMMKIPFRIRKDWKPELCEQIKSRISGFQSPQKVIETYLEKLKRTDLVHHYSNNKWKANFDRLNQIMQDKARKNKEIARCLKQKETAKLNSRKDDSKLLLEITQKAELALGSTGIDFINKIIAKLPKDPRFDALYVWKSYIESEIEKESCKRKNMVHSQTIQVL